MYISAFLFLPLWPGLLVTISDFSVVIPIRPLGLLIYDSLFSLRQTGFYPMV